MKRFFAFVDKWAGRIGSLAVFVSIMLSVTYFVSPDTRRLVELYLTNRQAWYFVGKINPAENLWVKNAQNFYHVNWVQYRGGEKRKINQSAIRSAIGDVLVHTNAYHVMGREDERPSSADHIVRNNKATTISVQYDCLVPWFFRFVDSEDNPVDDFTTKITYVSMKATKVTCR